MTDAPSVQPEAVVPRVEPGSPAPTPTPLPGASEVGAQPSVPTEERIRQMIAEATQAVLTQGREIGRRELQSQQDRNKAQLDRITRQAQTARERLQQADPDAAKDLELAELREERVDRATSEQQNEFHNNFIAAQTQFIKDLGLDPADSRIDWAADAENYLVAMQRIQTSVGKLQQEKTRTTQSGLEQRLRDLEAKMNQTSVEANSVNTAAPSGAPAGSDADFMHKFAAGELPMTKENLARVTKIQNQS